MRSDTVPLIDAAIIFTDIMQKKGREKNLTVKWTKKTKTTKYRFEIKMHRGM